MIRALVMGVVFLLLSTGQTMGGIWKQEFALKDLKKLYVETLLWGDVDKHGRLSEDWLRTKIELSCRNQGIRVVESLSYPQLEISVSLLAVELETGGSTRNTIYSINLGLLEIVTQPKPQKRETKVFIEYTWITGYTWISGTYGLCHNENVDTRVAEVIEGLMDKFMNDYLAANQEEERPSIYDVIGRDDG